MNVKNTGRRTKITQQEYDKRLNILYKGRIIALEPYINQRTKILHKCLKHNNKYMALPMAIMNGHCACKQCISEAMSTRRTYDTNDIKRILKDEFGDKFTLETKEVHGVKKKKLEFRHNIDDNNSHSFISDFYQLRTNKKCPVCEYGKYTRIVTKEENSIAITNPYIASLFVNKEETYMYKEHSNKKVHFKCPDCGYIDYKYINQVTKDNNVRCPVCSDGISYPNKFIFNMLLQIKETLDYLENEYYPEWCVYELNGDIHRGKYDIYFEYKNKKYIVEMDGGLGHGNKTFNSKERDTIGLQKDYIKDKLALEHGIEVIRIDANYGVNDKYEYIKNNVLQSELSNVLDLTAIDFDKVNINSLNSLFIKAVEMWNNGALTSEIAKQCNLNITTISSYLNKANNYSLCNYNGTEGIRRASANPVICLNNGKIYNSGLEAKNDIGVDGVYDCCKEKTFSCGSDFETKEKYLWMYKKQYDSLSKDELWEYIEKRVLNYYKEHKNEVPVVCTTTKEFFPNIIIASRIYDIEDTGIRLCIKGKIKTSGKLADGTRLQWATYLQYKEIHDVEELKYYNSILGRIKGRKLCQKKI